MTFFHMIYCAMLEHIDECSIVWRISVVFFVVVFLFFFFFQAEDGIRDVAVTGVQTCALPIYD